VTDKQEIRMTRYHNLECPDCKRQKLVEVPSASAFH